MNATRSSARPKVARRLARRLWFLAPFAAAAAPADRTAWLWEQTMEIKAPGVVRLDLPPATIDASQPSFADLRLLSPDGVETPWLFDKPAAAAGDVPAEDFKAVLDGRATVLTASHRAEAVVAVTLESPARGFLKAARIEGSSDATTWHPLVAGEVVFRQPDGPERLRVPLGPATWRHLRVIIDDDRSQPVAFTGLRITPASAVPEVVDHPVRLLRREEVAGESRLLLGLGAKNLHLAELKLDVPDGVFSRRCRVAAALTGKDGVAVETTVAEGTIYRVSDDSGAVASNLAIPVQARIPSGTVVLTIRNGDSPPLEVRGLGATRCHDRLLFFAKQTGTWKLLTGNRHAEPPVYDLAPLQTELARTPGVQLSPGQLTAKPDHQPPPALPEVTPAGSDIDLTGWACRRAVQAPLPAVIKVELDAVTLAHMARGDLGDLRLIQNNRQIPWLTEPSPPLRDVLPQVADDPDPKRPSLSRWRITLPVKGLPAACLTATSPDRLFSRGFRALVSGKDELGNPWTRVVGSATWTKSPNGNQAPQPLTIAIGGARLPEVLVLEADNGDNPPIRLENVVIRHEAPSLVAKVTDEAPLFLYYGNPRVHPPVYDLGLVRAELLSADKQAATLGAEETLQAAGRRDQGEVSAGSPWLWGALALVVVVLLVVVAKMLPRAAVP